MENWSDGELEYWKNGVMEWTTKCQQPETRNNPPHPHSIYCLQTCAGL